MIRLRRNCLFVGQGTEASFSVYGGLVSSTLPIIGLSYTKKFSQFYRRRFEKKLTLMIIGTLKQFFCKNCNQLGKTDVTKVYRKVQRNKTDNFYQRGISFVGQCFLHTHAVSSLTKK